MNGFTYDDGADRYAHRIEADRLRQDMRDKAEALANSTLEFGHCTNKEEAEYAEAKAAYEAHINKKDEK